MCAQTGSWAKRLINVILFREQQETCKNVEGPFPKSRVDVRRNKKWCLIVLNKQK